MNSFNLSGRRITALVLRHYYLIRGSIPRILEMAYWPTVQMVIWGFVTQFFIGHSSWLASAAGAFYTDGQTIKAILVGTGSILAFIATFRFQIQKFVDDRKKVK